MIVQRLAQTSDIAMTKNTEAATEDAFFLRVILDILIRQPTHNRLSHCQTDGLVTRTHRSSPFGAKSQQSAALSIDGSQSTRIQ